MSSCQLPQEELSAYLDDELEPDERHAVEQHLASCQTCKSTLAAWGRLGGLFEPFIDEPIDFAPVRRAKQRARTVLVASIVLVLTAGAVLIGQIGSPETSPFAGGAPTATASVTLVPTRDPDRQPTRPRPPVPGLTQEPLAPNTPNEALVSSSGDSAAMSAIMWTTASAAPSEALEISATLTNVTSQTVTFDAPTESVFDLVIWDENGVEVTRRSLVENWSGGTITRSLQAGESSDETFTVAAPSEPGEYSIGLDLRLSEPKSFATPLPVGSSPEPSPATAFQTVPVLLQIS
jgi:hypothetical protein